MIDCHVTHIHLLGARPARRDEPGGVSAVRDDGRLGREAGDYPIILEMLLVLG